MSLKSKSREELAANSLISQMGAKAVIEDIIGDRDKYKKNWQSAVMASGLLIENIIACQKGYISIDEMYSRAKAMTESDFWDYHLSQVSRDLDEQMEIHQKYGTSAVETNEEFLEDDTETLVILDKKE